MEKRTHKYLYWILTGLFVVSTVIAGYQYRRAEAIELTVENNYKRAFSELLGYVDDINTLLEKSMLCTQSAQMATLSSELFRQTQSAKACLSQLPVSHIQLENTEKFLSQVGDYTYFLSQKTINNEEISDEDYNNLSSLGDLAQGLKDELFKIDSDELYRDIGKNTAKNRFENIAFAKEGGFLSGMENIEKQFVEYPSLIYDGPFSEHIERINPKMLEGAKDISEQDAYKRANELIENGGELLKKSGESQNTAFDCYLFSYEDKNEAICAAITKKGGYPLYFLKNREVGEEKITVEDAIKRAGEYLSGQGFFSMKDSYFDKSNGFATINFAYKQGNVICYSDLIKVKVALDNGEIVGFEANGYLTSHKIRDFPTAKISEDEAKAKINRHLSVEGISLAYIPKDSKREVFCYEIRGKYKKRNFLVYINVENAREEEILMLIESDSGILTV